MNALKDHYDYGNRARNFDTLLFPLNYALGCNSSTYGADDIVLTERITGIPVAVINTQHVKNTGTKAGPLAKMMLKNNRTKHWMRIIYSLKAFWQLKHSSLKGSSYKDYFQAGKSVEGISEIVPVARIIEQLVS